MQIRVYIVYINNGEERSLFDYSHIKVVETPGGLFTLYNVTLEPNLTGDLLWG